MSHPPQHHSKHICFVGMLGGRGSYDATVYDDLDHKDDESAWFLARFGDVKNIEISTCNISHGDPLPDLSNLDGVVLGGSHNSVHDNTEWQQRLRAWLPELRARSIPILAICGAHQLLAQDGGANIEPFADGPYAGTMPISMTPSGNTSPILQNIPANACFQFGNSEHVANLPNNATLLASSGTNPMAILDFGNHCYSTQFHPECTHNQLSTIWRFKRPTLMDNYVAEDNGYKLVENFFEIVANQ